MNTKSYAKIFERDIDKLTSEISLFDSEEDLWVIAGDVRNSVGNLALHLCGNLKHFVGKSLGNSGYERKREKEFSLKNVPKSEILKDIDETKSIVLSTLNKLDESKLQEIFTEKLSLGEVETEFFLVHLLTHLNYHLGQINYIRRLMIK